MSERQAHVCAMEKCPRAEVTAGCIVAVEVWPGEIRHGIVVVDHPPQGKRKGLTVALWTNGMESAQPVHCYRSKIVGAWRSRGLTDQEISTGDFRALGPGIGVVKTYDLTTDGERPVRTN
jgi:hypothetical protein